MDLALCRVFEAADPSVWKEVKGMVSKIYFGYLLRARREKQANF